MYEVTESQVASTAVTKDYYESGFNNKINPSLIVSPSRPSKFQGMKSLAEVPAPPIVCESQRKRFEKVVKYYFPGDTSSFILGPPPVKSSSDPDCED